MLDFDGDGKKLVKEAFTTSFNSQIARNDQYDRDYKNYMGFIDMKNRNPDMVNVSINKLFNIVQVKRSRNTKGTLRMKPYIPFESINPLFRDQSDLLNKKLSYYLDKGKFKRVYKDGTAIKIAFGTSFSETLPTYEIVEQKMMGPDQQIISQPLRLLRLKFKTYSPWDIQADPYAVNLDEKDGCRYIIKMQLITKRQIMENFKKGAYPNLDPEELDAIKDSASMYKSEHRGLQMLREIGLPEAENSEDVGILLRYESPDRYIDVWNDVVLRDGPNPFKHGLINLSRHKHIGDIHTQNMFWGLGELKINEVMQALYNDLWNQALNNNEMHNHPMMFYRKGAVEAEDIVRVAGARVGLDTHGINDKAIANDIYEPPIHALTRDAYMLPGVVERIMDTNSAVHNPTRGEPSSGTQTATETGMLQMAGDTQLEDELEESEDFLADVGNKCLSMIHQFGTIQDSIDILGPEDAMRLEYANPNDLPGGWNYTFKGSKQAARLMIDQRNWKEVLPLLNHDALRPDATNRITFRKFEIEESEMNEAIIPFEELMAMQQQQQQQEFEREMALAEMEYKNKRSLMHEQASIKGELEQRKQGASKKEIVNNTTTTQRNSEKAVK